MYRNVSEYKFSELSKDAQQIVRENLNKKSNFFRQQMLDKSKMICQWGFMISAGSLASIVVLISTPHFYFLFNWIGWFIGSLVLCVTPFAVALYLDVFCFVRCESSKKKVIETGEYTLGEYDDNVKVSPWWVALDIFQFLGWICFFVGVIGAAISCSNHHEIGHTPGTLHHKQAQYSTVTHNIKIIITD